MKYALATDNGDILYSLIQNGDIHVINNIKYKIYIYMTDLKRIVRKVKVIDDAKKPGRPVGFKPTDTVKSLKQKIENEKNIREKMMEFYNKFINDKDFQEFLSYE